MSLFLLLYCRLITNRGQRFTTTAPTIGPEGLTSVGGRALISAPTPASPSPRRQNPTLGKIVSFFRSVGTFNRPGASCFHPPSPPPPIMLVSVDVCNWIAPVNANNKHVFQGRPCFRPFHDPQCLEFTPLMPSPQCSSPPPGPNMH